MTKSLQTINRLKRAEGQLRGVIKMLEEDRYCIDVLNQVQAVKAAISRAESQILKDHADSCILEAIETGNTAEQKLKVSELVDLFDKLKR